MIINHLNKLFIVYIFHETMDLTDAICKNIKMYNQNLKNCLGYLALKICDLSEV